MKNLNKSAHTPGPWLVGPGKRGTGVYFRPPPSRIFPEGTSVLVTEARIQHEDAVLIAAAPELLEALQMAQEIINNLIPFQKKYGVGIGPNEQADLDAISNAIAKATGASR